MEQQKIFIIKLWSAILIEWEKLNEKVMKNIVSWVVHCRHNNIGCILVTSWAVALGRQVLQKKWISGKKNDTQFEQMCASIGQPLLMKQYGDLFLLEGITISQLLLTRGDFALRESYKSVKEVLTHSLSLNIVPIINENDVLSPEELDFSDNDQLSALVAGMMNAQKLIILSNVDWLYDKHPDDGGKKIDIIHEVDDATFSMVDPKKSSTWKGWMGSKLRTAKLIMDLGIDMILASGKEENILERISEWEYRGTLFHASSRKSFDSMRKWLKAWAVPVWKLIVSTIIADLLKSKKRTSLLVIWVEKILSDFKKWDIVEVCEENGKCLGIGISKMHSSDVLSAKEQGESKIVIHTDYFNYLDDQEKAF